MGGVRKTQASRGAPRLVSHPPQVPLTCGWGDLGGRTDRVCRKPRGEPAEDARADRARVQAERERSAARGHAGPLRAAKPPVP
jgi:hypothetical protein